MTTAATPRATPATVRVVLFGLDGTVSVPTVTDTLATWQHLVAGSIEFVRLLSPLAAAPRDELVAIINEEGLYLQPPSPWVWPLGARAEVGTPIHGPFVVARWTYEPNGDDHAVELTRANLATIRRLFALHSV